MCDQDHFDDDKKLFEDQGLVTRRQFGVLLGAGMAMALPRVMDDGSADYYFVHPTTKAQFLVAIAANDDKRSPNDKTTLRDTFAKAKLAEVEVYDGAAHGWCPPDSGVYNEPQAEKAWSRLLALYGKALA